MKTNLGPKPALFRDAFDVIWHRLFSSPKHLDSLLAQSPPSAKSALAEICFLLLQRPRSLARYFRVTLSNHEPWELSMDELANWRTVHVLADRIFHEWRRDPNFYKDGKAVPQDYPAFMVEEWKKSFGKDVANELVLTLGERAPMSLRAVRKLGRDPVLSEMNDSKLLPIRGRASECSPLGFYFTDFVKVLNHPMFREGKYEIQDIGSQMMSIFALWPEECLPLLRKVPGKCRNWSKGKELPVIKNPITVIDACAGAGGKTLAIADLMGGKGKMFAYDVSETKLKNLKERGKRLGLNNIKTLALREGEEAESLEKFLNSADVVLVDSPCSGWGVLRRNPDIKWRLDAAGYKRLEKLQARLLAQYSQLVRPGGKLIYGVCTFRPEETTEQVKLFLENNLDFQDIGGGYYGPGPSDGFYFHAFRKEDPLTQ